MKKLIVTTVLLVMGFAFTIQAQQLTKTVTPTFKPGWYIGANGGANMIMGEGNNFFNVWLNNGKEFVSPFAKNYSGLGRVAAGYNFTPVVGLRGMLGYNSFNWWTVPQATPVQHLFGTESLTADLMLNLSNWSKGYNPDRKIDISLFAGLGAAYLNNNTATLPLAGIFRGGLQGDYHLTPALALNMILEANLATDNLNDLALAPLPVDVFPALTVGLTYQLPEYVKKVAPAVVEPTKPVEPVTPVTPPVTEPATVVAVEKPVVKPDTVKPVEPVVVPAVKPIVTPITPIEVAKTVVPGELNEHIFFAINNREVINGTQVEAMVRIAAYVKDHPNAKIIVSGFADRNTGTIDANNQVSKERAVNVANMLIRKYGVSYSNIHVKWYGGGIQPYEKAVKNRLVIVRTPNAKLTLAEPEKTYVPKVVKAVEVVQAADTTKKYADEGGLFLVVNFIDNVSDVTDAKQEAIIKKTAEYMKRHPEARIAVTGYADKSSGSADKNNILSKMRAESVANKLTQIYAIDSSRIQVKWFGGEKEKQAYAKPTMNRLALIETIN